MIGFNTFSKGISPKVNVIARLEPERAYLEAATQHFNYYATENPHLQTLSTAKEFYVKYQ